MPIASLGEVSVMRRFLIAVSAALLATILTAGPALAGTQWCVVDPTIAVNGRVSDVEVLFDTAYSATLTGPVTFRFHVPSNATATVGMPPSTVPYIVQVLYDLPAESKKSTTVTVETLVGSTSSFGVNSVVIVPKTIILGVAGTSNTTTSITYSIGN
jgi:hypothetical protein